MKVIRQNIHRLMEEQNLSQSELSRRSGVKKTSLNRYLRNSDIPVSKAKAIAHALGVTLAELSSSEIDLSPEEREIIECYRVMPVRLRSLMLDAAHIFADNEE